ncbi:pre-rRNA-processing protein TSR1 homolog [Lineus longissimus]|uniref:pre-rRNA-processing protein TSR1 homolog n=1 Tax=Lineus longissimus TaxID=88925 RepID=UPI002B4D41ED
MNMAADGQETHHSGAFKQSNKKHKHGQHKSKGELSKEQKGRVSIKTLSKKGKIALSRQERRNQAQQHRRLKRDEALNKKRSRGGTDSPPFLVVVIPLCDGLDTNEVIALLNGCDGAATTITNALGISHLSVPRFKQRFSFTAPPSGDLYAMLDAAKVADFLLFLHSPSEGMDSYGEYCLSCLFAQGLPACVHAVHGLKDLPLKKHTEIKKLLQKCIEKRFPKDKVHNLDTDQEGILVLRQLGSLKMAPLYLRDKRPHMLAEEVTSEPTENSDLVTLKVSGFVRGQALSVNGLVHIPGWGDFQMSQIDAPDDPYPLNDSKKKGKTAMDVEMSEFGESSIRVLERADRGQQESLQCEVIPDPMEGEQTWPTEEELAEADAAQKNKAVVKRVPKGTSEYQAAWIVDSGDENEDDDDDDDDDDEADDAMEAEEEGSESEDEEIHEDDEEFVTMTVTDGGDVTKYDAAFDIEEEDKLLSKYKESRIDEMFPDEVDTPKDVPAKDRFARYRGLKSFRTSPWDPKENLPADYARIFQFDDFRRMKKKILAEEMEDGAMPGWYVTLHIENVPRAILDTIKPNHPLVVYGLRPHEQKMSILHLVMKRLPSNRQPIKSKERMIFHVGYRRFAACPIYSQHTNAGKHKFERFLRNDGAYVATIYAPIIFPPASVMMFKENMDGSQDFVASGSVLSVNPARIIAKRIVLSGHPFKINKKMAVVRYMFFNREDILWFKPVELRTKYGRRGHIREPLGTHGHMKCVFDSQLKSQDTVLMMLYKRMYPKWTYDPHVLPPPLSTTAPVVMEMDTGLDIFDD